MRKIPVLLLSLLVAALFSLGCAQKQVKKEEPKVQSGFGTEMIVKASNEKLAEMPVKGFSADSAKLKKEVVKDWVKDILPAVREIISKMPEGYKLQVTGHVAKPRYSRSKKPVSTMRARAVYRELVKNGVPKDKLTYKGVGYSDPVPDIGISDPRQRRVTFKLVPST